MDRAPRHRAMVDFHQHQERKWCVLEEDHEKVEKENARLRAELDELAEAAREKDKDYFQLQSEVQNLRAALAARQVGGDELDAAAERNAMQRQRDQAREQLRRECDDLDAVLRLFNFNPDEYRTDGGSLNLQKLKADGGMGGDEEVKS
ncbi:hypothetical protein SA496_15735 [Pseudomonas sp. JS3066]|uniref:hypothetical protein n=1 Tax=Pseudomonas sp. JS3066 TaxID=3090665 RepID=UPI002E7B4EEB|nr:hypothetical protein [Pseudomonas sp. JS3066]WVK91180.1 hypothetical protein SA496_15735 [Pseudomonas sp. JS3066]